MTKIKNTEAYPYKQNPVSNDFVTGSDSEDDGKTVNYKFQDILNLINSMNGNEVVSYIFVESLIGELDENGSGYFFSENNELNPADITKIIVSKKIKTGIDLTPLFGFMSNHEIGFALKLRNASDPNNFVYFSLENITEQSEQFTFEVDIEGGDNYLGQLINSKTYVFEFDFKSIILPDNLEYTTNKQNSLTTDGTGVKYPTVDAVNSGISSLSTSSTKYNWFLLNATKREDYMQQREQNTAKAYVALSSREVNLSQVGDTYGHGAIIKLHQASTKLYIASIANQVNTGDNATDINCFVRLQILQGNTSGIINMPILSTTTIAKNGDVVGGKTIISGAGVPNAYLISDTLHIIWSAQGNDGLWYTMHNTVNCLTDVIGTPEICTMESGLMNSAKIAAHLGRTDNAMVSMNGTLTSFGGYYYSAAVCFDLWQKGAILRTTDFINWEFAKEPVFTGISPKAQWEISLGTLGSFMYMAMRQIELDTSADVNPIILAKLDASLNVVDWVEVPSCTSRPEFYLKGTTELYLVFPTDNRQNSVLLLIDPVLRNSRPVQDMPIWGNYTSIAQRGAGSSLQFAVRTQGSTGLRASSMNANNIASTAIMTINEYLTTVTSDVQAQINAKQATLVSGTNIKTVGGVTLLGSGNVTEVANDLTASTTIAPSKTAVNTALALKADLASPIFTGNPTAPTPTAGDNDTSIATTAFVQAATRPYKSYASLITQTGTSAPVPTVVENQLSGAIVWTRTGVGVYVGTLTGAFTAFKTLAFGILSSANVNYKMGITCNSVNTIQIATVDNTNTPIDGVLNASIEIRVYN